MNKLLFLFIFVLFSTAASSLTINEIMYNPSTEQGSDTSLEWIEIYNEENSLVDLSGWKIDNKNFDDYNISSGEYIIIARNKDAFISYYNASDYTILDGSFSLTNTEDLINLSNGTEEIIVNYNSNTGADGNGKTLEFYEGWYESININGTPGEINSVFGLGTDYSVIEINEFQPDPVGDDDFDMPNGEWVELYNSGDTDINIKQLVLYDSDDSNELYITDTNTLSGTIITSKGYLVIYRNGDSDFNLNNNKMDEIRLYDGYPVSDSTLIDSVSYTGTTENKTWAKIDGIWKKTDPTPDKENINTSLEYDCSSLRITEFFPDPLGDDSAPMPDGEWIELYNPTSNEIDLNGMLLTDSNNQKLYISSTTGKTVIGAEDYLVVYTNGKDGFLSNEDIEKISLFDKDGNFIDRAEYAGSKEGMSWAKIGDIWQQTMPTPGENNADNRTDISSHVSIEKIYDLGTDKKARFGQTIRVLLKIFKGSTTKNSIKLWAENRDQEKISKESKTNVYTYFTNYTLTLPLQLVPNCDHDFAYENYTLVVEGLDVRDTFDLSVEGITKDSCEYVEVEEEGKQEKGVEYLLADFPDTVFVDEEFESEITVENNDDVAHKFEIWSYIYRGNKCYSGTREQNKITKYLAEKSSKKVTLKNKISGAKDGLYKYKIKILKDDLKTASEITRDLVVENLNKETENQASVNKDTFLLPEENIKSEESSMVKKEEGQILLSNPRVLYQSTTVKTKKLIPYFFVSMMLMLVFFLIMRKL